MVAASDEGSETVEYWKQECARLREQLESAESDIADFTESSKELQDELERELSRLEKSEDSLKRLCDERSNEAEEWKTKYKESIAEHTRTVTQLSRELEQRRKEERALRDRLREIELDNDEMEKSERQKDSTLNDLEARYNRSIERIALLEDELVQKASLVEQVQRLRDELRDLNEEVVLRNSKAKEGPTTPTPPSASASTSEATERNASPSKSKIPQSPSMSGFASSPYALARSVRTTFVPTPPSTTVTRRKPEATIADLRMATSRLKAISASLSQNRDLRATGSYIPRASLTPKASRRTSLSTTVRHSAVSPRPPSRATTSASEEEHSRPPSRSMLRQSTRAPSTSAVPRPSSRLSHVPVPSSSLSASVRRPTTPVDRPTSSSLLAQSARRRVSTPHAHSHSASMSSSPVPPVPSLPPSRAKEYAAAKQQGSMFGLGRPGSSLGHSSGTVAAGGSSGSGAARSNHDRDQLARRASLALGRSVLNKR